MMTQEETAYESVLVPSLHSCSVNSYSLKEKEFSLGYRVTKVTPFLGSYTRHLPNGAGDKHGHFFIIAPTAPGVAHPKLSVICLSEIVLVVFRQTLVEQYDFRENGSLVTS